jgi:uncharacterized protein (DUF433 family)
MRLSTEYVEQRDDGYFVSASRISLESIVYAFRRGESPEAILEAFPGIGSLAKVYGAIAFALDNPCLVDDYLKQQEREWEDARRGNPSELIDRVRRARSDKALRSS